MNEASGGLAFTDATKRAYASLRLTLGPIWSGHIEGSYHKGAEAIYVGVEAGAADISGTESSVSTQNDRPR